MAFLEFDVTSEEVDKIQTRLDAMDGVKAEYFSQDDAIRIAGEINEMLVSGYTDEQLREIYQPYFKITFDSLEAEDEITELLRTLDGVGDAENYRVVSESAEKSIREAKSMKIIAITAMILIIELSIFLMMNSTKLMLYARRKEISIMKYVGAKDTFVKAPFAIEGVIIATVAVIVVILMVSLCYEPIVDIIGKRASYKYLTLGEVMEDLRGILLLIGFAIGAFGSTISMNKYLDV